MTGVPRVFPGRPAPPAGHTDCFVEDGAAEEARAAGAATLWVHAPARPETGRWIAPAGSGAQAPDAWAMAPDQNPPADARPFFVTGRAAPERIAELLDARPGPVVLRHLNSAPGDLDALLAALDLAVAQPGLWLETSGAVIGVFAAEAARRVPDRVVFGSGAPAFDPRAQAGHVASVLPPEAARAVFLDNPARLSEAR